MSETGEYYVGGTTVYGPRIHGIRKDRVENASLAQATHPQGTWLDEGVLAIELLAEALNVKASTNLTPRALAERVKVLEAELSDCRNHIRPLSDKAELADTYEAWLLDIGRQVGCQHLDEQLPNCVISVLEGDRDQEELALLRREAEWIRRKLELPDNCPFLSGNGQTVAGEMHVVCSNAHGFKTYIQAHKCDDKQGEISRLTIQNAQLAEQRDEFAAMLSEVRLMLTTELKDYQGEPWAQRILARVNQPAAAEGAA